MKPLVALSGLYYPVAILRYFEEALRRRGDIQLVTVGPDFGTWLPWKAGMHLPYTMYPVDVPLPMVNNGPAVPVSFVEARVRGKLGRLPDMWLQVDAGYYFNAKPSTGYVAHVATDPHCLNYDAQRAIADDFYCMQTPYMKEGDHWLPYAYCPKHHAFIEDDERPATDYDAALVGLMYDTRLQWARALRNQGLRVFLDTGPSYADARKIYASAITGFNWSSLQDTVARCFELMAMGVPSAMNRVPDLCKLFKPEVHFLPFDDLGGAIRASKTLIQDEALRSEVRDCARLAVEPHTYDARVATILTEAQLV